MKLALIQFNPRVGDIELNLKRTVEFISEAKRQGASLVLFPELSLMGYPPRDLLEDFEKVQANVRALTTVARSCRGMAAVVGFVEPNSRLVGKPFYNAAALLTEGNVQTICRKQLLPYYDVFEEERFFEAGSDPGYFEYGGLRFGVTICEDVWNFPEFLPRTYPHQPLDAFKTDSPDVLINLSASPFSLGKPSRRVRVFEHAAGYVKTPLVSVGQVGGNDHLLFDGCSLAVNRDGKVVAAAAPFTESILMLDTAQLLKPGPSGKFPWPTSENEWLLGALKMGLRDYVSKCGAKGVCLGMSGGIDSSVCAAIAVQALGPENVVALGLPTQFTAPESLADAQTLADRIGIEYHCFSIETIFNQLQSELTGLLKSPVPAVTWENIQPRLRMTILMALSNARGLFLLNTSNKSEIATGFSTLYGDSAGALSLLGDVTKTQVYRLAEYLNRSGEIIPPRVLTRAPTAELRAHQVDQDVLPPYPILDTLIQTAIVDKKNLAPSPDKATQVFIDKFLTMVAHSEYKRGQLGPTLRVSARAFGMGRRVPVAASP